MPVIVSTVHDPVALAATCEQIGLALPVEGSGSCEGRCVYGWFVCVPGLHAPLYFDTLTGLVSYHPRDNQFGRYVRIMRLIHRYYHLRAATVGGRRCRSARDRRHQRRSEAVA